MPMPIAGDHSGDKPTNRQDMAVRRHFLQLSDDDRERLRECQPAFSACVPGFVDAFYAHLSQFTETAQFLNDEGLVDRLKLAQQQHFATMLEAVWDDAFEESRRQVGRTHAERGVEPAWVIGSYNLFAQHCLDHFDDEPSQSNGKKSDKLSSVLKAIFLDIGLTLDEYFHASTEDLRRALDMYFKANNDLRQFAQLTSHDLKTPLGTVANLCEEVLDEFGDQIPEDARQLIQSAKDTTYRMSETIDELLTTTVSQSSERRLTPVSLEGPICQAIESILPGLRLKGIELSLPSDFPYVVANEVQLREVFHNLLSNAMKYVDTHPGEIRICWHQEDGHTTVVVQDNGPGIPTEEQARVFAPFRRLSQHRQVSGTGLGLYFTKYLVEQQGGQIWLESETGKGSTFFVRLKSGKA